MMEASATAPSEAVKDVTKTTQSEPAVGAVAEETQKDRKEEVSEAAPEAASESAGRRRSSRLSTSTTKAPAPPPTEKKKRGPKKRSAEEAGKDEGVAENGTAKKTKTDTEPAKGLTIGDTLPALTLKNEKGEDVSLQDLATDSGLVLFLVPKADTPGCTQQACGFRDIYPDFQAVNYKVYCLSADSPTAQTKWQTKKSLPYPLLSDPQRELIGALTGANARTPRSHFIFEKGGRLVDRKMPVKPVDSPKLAIAFIKGHNVSANAETTEAKADS